MIIEIRTAPSDPEVGIVARKAIKELMKRLGYPVDFIESRVDRGYDAALKAKTGEPVKLNHRARHGTDNGPVLPLEKRKVRAGHWRIEGYEVIRLAPSTWAISLGYNDVHVSSSLKEAIDWIASGGAA